MHSLTHRLVAAASAILAGFLGIMGWILDAAIRDSLEQAIEQRLQAHVYTLLAAADITPEGDLLMPEQLPEARFNRPDSGLYATVLGDGFFWRSPSTVGENPQLPVDPLAPGESSFRPHIDIGPEAAFVLRQGIAWETAAGGEKRFVIAIAEHERTFRQQLGRFRQTLWSWMSGVGVILIIIMVMVLRWGLRPLRRVSGELSRVKRGEQDHIRGVYPRELEALTASLNGFIESERKHLSRYRNSLSDLAHSLKTPLAVLRSLIESGQTGAAALTEVDRMDELVAWQLKRARSSGHLVLSRPLAAEPVAEQVVTALEKVYADKHVVCEFELEPDLQFHGDRGDLMELLGNLLDNAFKWCRSRVVLAGNTLPAATRNGIVLRVTDDGPGVPADRVRAVLARGVRADERAPGHGIGLAIVADLVEAYGGTIDIRRAAIGGAEVEIRIPGE